MVKSKIFPGQWDFTNVSGTAHNILLEFKVRSRLGADGVASSVFDLELTMHKALHSVCHNKINRVTTKYEGDRKTAFVIF